MQGKGKQKEERKNKEEERTDHDSKLNLASRAKLAFV